jgi:rhodanese-related sulfurtransferase
MTTHNISPMSISVAALHSKLGHANAPLILDVRLEPAYRESSRMISSALRCEEVLSRLDEWRGKQLVVYCKAGHEVGQEAAAKLREQGVDARYLEGGIEAWNAAKLVTTQVREAHFHSGGQVWVTRARPKIDRIACPWLIRRFIDATAKFEYVPADQVLSYAEKTKAIPYDVPGVQFTHRGAHCSFDALLEDFDLHDAALDKLALIVRGADTDQLQLAPQSAGLLALSLGFSANFTDDNTMLEQAMPMYDALYAWCQQQKPEQHGWNFPS